MKKRVKNFVVPVVSWFANALFRDRRRLACIVRFSRFALSAGETPAVPAFRRSMPPTLMRMTVAIPSLFASLVFGVPQHYTLQEHVQPIVEAPAAQPLFEPVQEPAQEVAYPEGLSTDPSDIAHFISEHPVVNLESLWKRLKIKNDDPAAEFRFGDQCNLCEVHIFEYNLTGDATREAVLQIKQSWSEVYRYLIFKDARERTVKFLGHIDVWAKYPPADPTVLLSNGRAWLIVQSTAATGSGLGAWRDTVYEVSDREVRPVGSYFARVNQSGFSSMPTKVFVGSLGSCEIKNRMAILTVSYTVKYTLYSERNEPLFTKQQRAVLRGSLKDGSVSLDAARSEIQPQEFATIYNFDSMDEDDLLKYNFAELRAIAIGNDSEKKEWLKEFLVACRNNKYKRQLLSLLKTVGGRSR